MSEFLTFFDDVVFGYPMHLEIYYSKIMDWVITVYKGDKDHVIIRVQEQDMELCFAKAQVELKEWLLENQGGY